MSIKRTKELRDVLLLEVIPTTDDLHAAMRNRGWCEPRKCFFKVAGTRALFELDPDGSGSHHFHIDAGSHVDLIKEIVLVRGLAYRARGNGLDAFDPVAF